MDRLEYFSDGYLIDPMHSAGRRYEVACITAEYGNDRPDILGVSRITSINIEYVDRNIPSQLESDAEAALWNELAALEYIDEDDDFKNEAASDVSAHTGVSMDRIIIER
ncbi:MAG: hypothetical protein IJR85_01730 [Synergistaceae bacterium]|nr:hypothetical protein [Synergistaceae bacterium]